jgi:tellurite resistance protein TehA-like permease/hemerythrin-like domain-containing protein
LEVNTSPNCAAILKYLEHKTDISTVPILFVNGDCVGGCTDLKLSEHTGEFHKKLGPYFGKAMVRRAPSTRLGLLWYPEVVNAHVARLTSLLSAIVCILCIGFYRRPVTRWAVLGLAIDYLLRFTYGATYSIGGSCAAMLLANVPPRFACGPPKQFAAACGLFFSVFAAGLYLGSEPSGGAVVLGLLMGAALLEGVFDFCLGCWMFSQAIALKLMSPAVYSPYLNLLASKKWGHEYSMKEHNVPRAVNEHVLTAGQVNSTPVDLIRKNRLETESKLRDVNLVRNLRIDFFAVPMTVAALSFMFLSAFTVQEGRFETESTYKALGIFAACVFTLLFMIYLTKAILFPRKVVKEWRHHLAGNFFSAVSITIILEGIVLMPSGLNGGITLVWIGSVLQMLITVLRLADLIYEPTSEEHLNPSLMFAPVGNFIAAVAMAQIRLFGGYNMEGNMNYLFIARLWFGVAALFAIVLFTLTFRRALLDHHSDERVRPTLWVWLATASIAGPAYWAVSGFSLEVARGVLFQSLWCIALLFFTLNAAGYLRAFYTYPQDLSVWIVPFSLAAFAASTVNYYRAVNENRDLFFVLSCFAMATACFSAVVCAFQTVTWALDLSLFTPRPKWGPLSTFKLLHECLRHAIPKQAGIFAALSAKDSNAVEFALADLQALLVTFLEHSRHEDTILFPRVRRFFPGLNLDAEAEHGRLHSQVHTLQSAVTRYAQSDKGEAAAQELLNSVNAVFPEWQSAVEQHLRKEEQTFTVVVRKYFPLEYQIEVSREVFDSTSAESWRVVLPFVVNNLPHYTWKVRYVKALLWGNALRAQEVGLALYHGVETDLWNLLVREIPHLAPRGLATHKRLY